MMEPVQSTEGYNLQDDVLQLAGSKMSLKDVLERQLSIPTYNGRKFYKVEDITQMNTTINGLLRDVSEKAYSNKLRFEELQMEINQKDTEINQKDTEIAELKQACEQLELELSTMVNNSEADVLRDRIRALENEKLEYQDATKRMAEDVQVKIDELSDIVTETQNEAIIAKADLDRAQRELDTLRSEVNDYRTTANEYRTKATAADTRAETLQAELDALHERYALLETKHMQSSQFARERIQELMSRISD